MTKKKNFKENEFGECLDGDDCIEEGFIDGDLDLKNCIVAASFSFGGGEEQQPFKAVEPEVIQSMAKGMCFQEKAANESCLTDNRTHQTKPNGRTPPVDGEKFEVTRTFVFRRSTVRMLNRIKAEHPDENVYLSSIVDEALRFYYNNMKRENN